MPRVSVIVPVYNVEKYLSRCLDSIIAQTERDIEIICVDDGSTDSSPEILRGYAAKDARVRIVTQENKGLSGARNAGLDVFCGDWVMFVDSDDWVPPYAAEGFLKVATESGESAVVSEFYARDRLDGVTSAAGLRWSRISPALPGLVGRRKMQSSAWNKFYRADLVRRRRFVEGIYFEDWPFVTELFGNLESFALVHAPMYVYCTNGGAGSIIRSPFNARKVASYLRGAEYVAGNFPASHPRHKAAMKRIGAALATMIGKVSKAKSPALAAQVVAGLRELDARHPGILGRIGLKARFRLWRLSRFCI